MFAIEHQVGDLNWQNEQAVFYSGTVQKDGRMKLTIPDGQKHWGSMYNGMGLPDTLHGDPRHPMAILGPRLSYLMGYEVNPKNSRLGMNGPVEIISPAVDLTQKTLEKINAVLKRQNKELIGFALKKAGLVNEDDGLRLTLTAPENFEFAFPFHDTSIELTPHEEAYHKNFVIPQELTRRARNINQAIVGFQDRLKANGLDQYATFIKQMRWEETDYASGTITTTLAEFNSTRLTGRLTQESASEHTNKMADLITLWFRPELTAFETLVQYLTLHDTGLRVYLQRHHPRWVENTMAPKNLPPQDAPEFVGNKYQGTPDYHATIFQLLKDYEIALRSDIRPALKSRKSAQVWAEQMLSTHAARVAEITEALELVLKEAGVTTATHLFKRDLQNSN